MRKDLDALIAKYKTVPMKAVAKKRAGKVKRIIMPTRIEILKEAIKNHAMCESMDTQNGVTYRSGDKLRFVLDMEIKYSSIKDVKDLPVRDYTKAERKKHLKGRNFWSVTPTGEYGRDCDTGHEYATLTYTYMRNTGMSILSNIVFDMIDHANPERDKGLIVGFFYYMHCFLMGSGGVGYMLFDREIANTSTNILLHNDRVKKESKKLPITWSYEKGKRTDSISLTVGKMVVGKK